MKLYEIKDYEAKYLQGNLHHMYVHPQENAFLMGSGGLLIGFTLLGLILKWPVLPIVSASILLLFSLVHFYKTIRHCKCGKHPILNASVQDELRGIKIRKWRYQLLRNFLNSKFLLLLVVFSAVASLFNILSTTILPVYIVCVASIVLGFHSLYCAFRNIPPLYIRLKTIDESELQKVEALSGETEEELEQIIDFCMRAGEYEKAELYSRKLLNLSCAGQITEKEPEQEL